MWEQKDPFPVTLTDGQHVSLELPRVVSQEIYDVHGDVKITVYDTENREYRKFEKIAHDEKYGGYSPRKI